VPLALAASMTARPAGSIRPSRSSRSMRTLLGRDHPLVGRRGAYHCMLRSSSSVFCTASIQPNRSASQTAAS